MMYPSTRANHIPWVSVNANSDNSKAMAYATNGISNWKYHCLTGPWILPLVGSLFSSSRVGTRILLLEETGQNITYIYISLI